MTQWQSDFDRFLGGGLRAITAQTVREHSPGQGQDLWIVSLDLLAVNDARGDGLSTDNYDTSTSTSGSSARSRSLGSSQLRLTQPVDCSKPS